MIHKNKQNRKKAPMFNTWGKRLHISYLIKKTHVTQFLMSRHLSMLV